MTSVKCMEDIFTGCRSPFRDSNGYVVTYQTTFRKCKVVSGFFSPKTKNILLLCDVKYEDILTNKKIFWTYYYRFTSKCLYITQQHFYIY